MSSDPASQQRPDASRRHCLLRFGAWMLPALAVSRRAQASHYLDFSGGGWSISMGVGGSGWSEGLYDIRVRKPGDTKERILDPGSWRATLDMHKHTMRLRHRPDLITGVPAFELNVDGPVAVLSVERRVVGKQIFSWCL